MLTPLLTSSTQQHVGSHISHPIPPFLSNTNHQPICPLSNLTRVEKSNLAFDTLETWRENGVLIVSNLIVYL